MMPTRPVVVRAAPTIPRIPAFRLPSASPASCDWPAVESFHLHSVMQRLVAHCRKSHARIPDAWEARNCRQVGGARRGAGVSPAAARIRRIVPAPMRYPRPRSSPWMRRCPHRGFCPASRRTSSRISSGTGGRPAAFGIGPFLLDQAPVPGEQGGGCHDPVQRQVPGQQPCQARRSWPGQPSPVSGGRPDGAPPRPRAAVPRSPRLWRCRCARAAPASRTPGS